MIPESSLPDSEQSFAAQVWRLQTPRVADPSQLSWRTRPEREILDTVWVIHAGSTLETNEFHCPSGSILSARLACEDPLCNLEVLQRVIYPSAGRHEHIHLENRPYFSTAGLWLEQQQSA